MTLVHSGQEAVIPIELVERLDVASEGSRELDWRIAEMFAIPEPWRVAVGVWPPFVPGSKYDKEIPSFTTSLDAALALAERVLDPLTALGLLHAIIEAVGGNGWPSSRIPPLFCAAILKATTASSVGTERSEVNPTNQVNP